MGDYFTIYTSGFKTEKSLNLKQGKSAVIASNDLKSFFQY